MSAERLSRAWLSNAQVLVLVVLFAAHASWIGFHMSMVARDRIDPWKLGGYAMYTVPNRQPRLGVYNIEDPANPVQLERKAYRLAALLKGNSYRSFRCRHHSNERLAAFFSANPALKGVDTALVWTDRMFVRNPVGVKRRIQGTVQITWRDGKSFDYISTFCGERKTGTVAVQSLSKTSISLVYDDECPVCRNYCKALALREIDPHFQIIDARSDHPMVRELKTKGYDLNEGFVLKVDDRIYHGAQAIHALALVTTRSGFFNRLNYAVFRSPALSSALYPVLKAGRKLLLKILGRRQIEGNPDHASG